MRRSTIEKRVLNLNNLIAKLIEDDTLAIEPDSTWESCYAFKPVVLTDRFIYFEYKDVYLDFGNPISKERYCLNNFNHEDEIKYKLNWFLRAIKKGIKENLKQAKQDLYN